ncbi:MAG: hypothetical protein Tsb0021_18030 [Chlamydiales bacterium]
MLNGLLSNFSPKIHYTKELTLDLCNGKTFASYQSLSRPHQVDAIEYSLKKVLIAQITHIAITILFFPLTLTTFAVNIGGPAIIGLYAFAHRVKCVSEVSGMINASLRSLNATLINLLITTSRRFGSQTN